MDKIKKTINKVKTWVKQNPKEAAILVVILIVGAFLRLYRIGEYMTFLGDEGRDVIIVRRLLVDFDPILIGPRTSIGDMYLGPLYYYLMAPALLLANFSPAGPAIGIALLGVVTIFFVWWMAKELFPAKGKPSIPALITAGLYAIAPTIIIYSRSSWNPNIMPFFALLSIYGIWRVWQHKGWKWLIVSCASFAFVLQSHYLGLLLGPVIGFFWLLIMFAVRKVKREKKNFFKYSLISASLFIFLMSPLAIFDARHEWRNFASMKKFFTERQTTVSARPWKALPYAWPNFVQINTRLLTGHNEKVGLGVSVVIVMLLLWLIFYKRKELKSRQAAFLLLAVWLGFSLLGLGLYKQHVYDHYFGFFFPVPFLILGGLAEQILKLKNIIFKSLFFAGCALLIFVNLQNMPIKGPPNRQMQRSEEVALKIIQEAGDEKFNLAVIAERNYEGAYQYFLEVEKSSFIMIDPQNTDETITEQLFVVCELPREKCDPVNSPKAEVANFGWSKIEEEWEVAAVTLFKLVHTE